MVDVIALLKGPDTPLYLAPQAGVSESPFIDSAQLGTVFMLGAQWRRE